MLGSWAHNLCLVSRSPQEKLDKGICDLLYCSESYPAVPYFNSAQIIITNDKSNQLVLDEIPLNHGPFVRLSLLTMHEGFDGI